MESNDWLNEALYRTNPQFLVPETETDTDSAADPFGVDGNRGAGGEYATGVQTDGRNEG